MNKARPLIGYVAGPYRDPRGDLWVERNIRRAERVAVALWQMGIPALTPHLNTAFLDRLAPDEVWLAGGLEMLRRCDLVVVVPDEPMLREVIRSAGTMQEIAEAKALKIPVYWWPADREQIEQFQWLESNRQ